MELFEIQNPLLKDAFFGSGMCIKSCPGYLYEDKKHIGRAFLEYCFARIFCIHRFPGFEPFYIRNLSASSQRVIYGDLSERDIDAACDELLRLYSFVQTKLVEDDLCHNGRLSLFRSLRDYEIDAAASKILTQSAAITIPANIMNSYTYDASLHDDNTKCYNSNVSVTREVEIPNILFVDKYVQKPNGICGRSLADSEKEVWVLEKSVFGEITLDFSCFKVKHAEVLRMDGKSGFKYAHDCDHSIYELPTIHSLPCEDNWLIRFLINHRK